MKKIIWFETLYYSVEMFNKVLLQNVKKSKIENISYPNELSIHLCLLNVLSAANLVKMNKNQKYKEASSTTFDIFA